MNACGFAPRDDDEYLRPGERVYLSTSDEERVEFDDSKPYFVLAAGGSYHSTFAAITRSMTGHERTEHGGILIVPKNILGQGSTYHKDEKLRVVIGGLIFHLEIEEVVYAEAQWSYHVGLGDGRCNNDEEGGWICQDKLRQYEAEAEAFNDVR